MPDYADWTESIELLGTEIQVPIDIQGAFIQLPIDIQGQYVTLEMDIVAQSVGNIGIDIKAQTVGNISVNIAASAVTMNVAIQSSAVTLNVNIAASAVTMNVNIAASAVTINMDIKAQSVGVYLQPEWAAKEGLDKNFRVLGQDLNSGDAFYADYTVPTGKTLYICGLSFQNWAVATANRDLNQMARGIIKNQTNEVFLAEVGGNGGGNVSFPKPMKIAADKIFRYMGNNLSNHITTSIVTTWGYEI